MALGERGREMLEGHRRRGTRLLRRHSCIPLVGRRRLSAAKRESQQAAQRKKSPYYGGIPYFGFLWISRLATAPGRFAMPDALNERVTPAGYRPARPKNVPPGTPMSRSLKLTER